MSCVDVMNAHKSGSLYCERGRSRQAEFIACFVSKACRTLQAKGIACTPQDILLFQTTAGIVYSISAEAASCANQPAPGAAGQPCAPGTACCPQCQGQLQCNKGTCCAPPPHPGFGQATPLGCPCATNLARNPGTGQCCPDPSTLGSPCSAGCPCPAPMQCLNGQCCLVGYSIVKATPQDDSGKPIESSPGKLQAPQHLWAYDMHGVSEDIKKALQGNIEGSAQPCGAYGCAGCPNGEACYQMYRRLGEPNKSESWSWAQGTVMDEKCADGQCEKACMCVPTTTAAQVWGPKIPC